MTKIEKVIKDVSDLHRFYAKIQKRKKNNKKTHNQALRRTRTAACGGGWVTGRSTAMAKKSSLIKYLTHNYNVGII